MSSLFEVTTLTIPFPPDRSSVLSLIILDSVPFPPLGVCVGTRYCSHSEEFPWACGPPERTKTASSSPRKRGPIVTPMDSRFRGNDVIFRRAAGDEESRSALKILRARFLGSLGMTVRSWFSHRLPWGRGSGVYTFHMEANRLLTLPRLSALPPAPWKGSAFPSASHPLLFLTRRGCASPGPHRGLHHTILPRSHGVSREIVTMKGWEAQPPRKK